MKDTSPRAASRFTNILNNGVFMPAYLVGAFAIGLTLVYAQWFDVTLKYSLSKDTAVWGQFGDFIGGVLNPVCAYMAFVWLVRSYALQKTELAETRVTLAKSEEAQRKQAETALKAARLNALSIKLQAVTGMASFELSEVTRLSDLQRQHVREILYNSELRSVSDLISEKQVRIADLQKVQDLMLTKINVIESELI